MSQTQFEVAVADQATANAIVAKGENVAGVKFVNVNVDSGLVVVTHGEDFDEGAFKSAIGI